MGRLVRPRRGSQSFEALYHAHLGYEEAWEVLVVAHYRHAHTGYDKDRQDIDTWLTEREVRNITGGMFKSFEEALRWYYT